MPALSGRLPPPPDPLNHGSAPPSRQPPPGLHAVASCLSFLWKNLLLLVNGRCISGPVFFYDLRTRHTVCSMRETPTACGIGPRAQPSWVRAVAASSTMYQSACGPSCCTARA